MGKTEFNTNAPTLEYQKENSNSLCFSILSSVLYEY